MSFRRERNVEFLGAANQLLGGDEYRWLDGVTSRKQARSSLESGKPSMATISPDHWRVKFGNVSVAVSALFTTSSAEGSSDDLDGRTSWSWNQGFTGRDHGFRPPQLQVPSRARCCCLAWESWPPELHAAAAEIVGFSSNETGPARPRFRLHAFAQWHSSRIRIIAR